MNPSEVFLDQAQSCRALGSPFTADVLTICAGLLTLDTPVMKLIDGWDGDLSSAGHSVPLRLAGGFHALVLTRQDAMLAGLYPPNAMPSSDILAAALTAALKAHSEFLIDWMQSAPQTNEVARSAPLLAAGHFLGARFKMPLRLLELGASAGLNSFWDEISLDLNGQSFGPNQSALTLSPTWTGAPPQMADLKIHARSGVDLNPLDARNPKHRLRLMAYLWPDQPDRLERMQSALTLAEANPPELAKADAIAWLVAQLAEPAPNVATVIYHTIAWQYFPAAQQREGTALIENMGARATNEAPLAWLSLEADGQDPGAAFTLRLWPGNHTVVLGRADFHGRWVDWKAPDPISLF